jgi:hypothetical protein
MIQLRPTLTSAGFENPTRKRRDGSDPALETALIHLFEIGAPCPSKGWT